jgi:hypothetical protein
VRLENERAQQERAAAIQKRIDFLNHTGAAYGHMADSGNIRQALEDLRAVTVTADMFGDRSDEAEKAKDVAIGNLREILSAAEAREADEAAAAKQAQREEMLATIRDWGESALLAVQDGSADVEQLRANLQVLEGLAVSLELAGPMFDQMTAARDVAIAQAKEAIAATEERDRLAAEAQAERQRVEAEEAERQRQEQVRRAIAMQRDQLMQDNAILLFDAAQALVDRLETHGTTVDATLNRLTDDVRNILRRVPKESSNA